jgi:hypothetical protein
MLKKTTTDTCFAALREGVLSFGICMNNRFGPWERLSSREHRGWKPLPHQKKKPYFLGLAVFMIKYPSRIPL